MSQISPCVTQHMCTLVNQKAMPFVPSSDLVTSSKALSAPSSVLAPSFDALCY